MKDQNPYTTPETDPALPVPEDDGRLVPATRGMRFIGAFVDGLVGAAIAVPISFALQHAGLFDTWMEMDDVQWIIITALHFPIYIAVQWYFLNSTGQTIGKKFANTRIVTMKGTKPAMMDLIFRREGFSTAIALIPIVGDYLVLINVLAIFRKDRRCLHDWVAGTRVVQVDPLPEYALQAGSQD